MTTQTLTYGQQMTLDTIVHYGPIHESVIAEEVLDCDPTPAEERAAREIVEQLVAAGLVTVDGDSIRATGAGRDAAGAK